MWFKVEQKRSSIGQKYAVRCNSEIAGSQVVEERLAKGPAEARKTAEILASSLNVTATVYGTDADGEFVHGVYEVAEGAAAATNPLIKRLFAESAAASLTLKDQLLADIPEDTIKGFAAMSAALRRRSAIRPSFVFFAAETTAARCPCKLMMPRSRS
jgi:hypothetical protein